MVISSLVILILFLGLKWVPLLSSQLRISETLNDHLKSMQSQFESLERQLEGTERDSGQYLSKSTRSMFSLTLHSVTPAVKISKDR